MLRAIAIAAEDEHMKKIEEERLKALMIAEGALEGIGHLFLAVFKSGV